MTISVFINPEKTTHFKHLLTMKVQPGGSNFDYCHIEGIHLRTCVSTDEVRKAAGLGYRIDFPGPLPYFLPHWLLGAVTHIEATVPVYDLDETERFCRATSCGSVCLLSHGIDGNPPEGKFRGSSLGAIWGVLRELHGGDMGPNDENVVTERTRLWLYSPSGKLYQAVTAHHYSQEPESLGARVYADAQAFRQHSEVRAFGRHVSPTAVGEEAFDVVTVLYPQGSCYEPGFGFVRYIDYPGQLQSYPDYIGPNDILAVSIQTTLTKPVLQSDFDQHVTQASVADRWMVGFSTTDCHPRSINAALIGAGTLEKALEQYRALVP